jgi:hypothetical protein
MRRALAGGESARVDLSAVREISVALNETHRFIYLVPEAAQEAARFGVSNRVAYLAFRAAAMGAVPWQVVLAAFYNFSPRAVQEMTGVWDVASPERWQAARFEVALAASRRVGAPLAEDAISEARSLIDPVVAEAELAGKVLAAANASVALPPDPLVALWQQITVLREWRGDAHLTVLAHNGVGPCECIVIHAATAALPAKFLRASRQWNDEEWHAAADRLVARGWLAADGSVTDAGVEAREQIEVETDEHCAALWKPIGAEGARRLVSLITPIDAAFTAAGTYERLT